MPNKAKSYQENFIAGIKILMADAQLESYKVVASYLGIGDMSLYKIIDGSRNPTIEQCIVLCEKAGYSANWMFLNIGEMKLERQETLEDIAKSIKMLSAKIK